MRRISFGILMLLFLFGIMYVPNAIGQYAYKGLGIFTAGDLWETVIPTGIKVSYHEVADVATTLNNTFRLGQNDRQWTTPCTMWPAGMNMHLPWELHMHLIVYSPDEINTFTTDTDPRAKHYLYAFPTSKLAGAASITSNNMSNAWGAANWVDPNKRHAQIYEAWYPTNVGVEIKVRARQFAINTANMNDFIAFEFELTNNGIFDPDGDGNPEATNHKIDCFSFGIRNEVIGGMENTKSGTRSGAMGWNNGRCAGFDATPDQSGSPWALPVTFRTHVPDASLDANGWVPDGERIIGQEKGRPYMVDAWDGRMFLAVKQGNMDGGSAAPDKKTIYDSHPIGEGSQRGWFVSGGRQWGNEDYFPYEDFVAFSGVFYADGGKNWDRTAIKTLKPDPNWFDVTQSYEEGNPISFVNIVKAEGARGKPSGDMKSTDIFRQNWERNFPGTPDPGFAPGEEWLNGFSAQHNFDGDATTGIGPFSLDVGETITVVFIEYAGHRLQGVRDAVKTARWAYENNWNIPEPPPTPDISVQRTVVNDDYKIAVKWDNLAETASDFAGYKVYRVTAYPLTDMTKYGVQLMDHFNEQTDPNMTMEEVAANFAEPNNPNTSVKAGYWQNWDPGPWGPWKLIANVTKAQLSSYLNPDADASTYKYIFVDASPEVSFGRTFWYYVAAYDNESGTIAGVNFTSLETHRSNWNGASGQWEGTYFWTTGSPYFPTTAAGIKAIGANFVLEVPQALRTEILEGAKKIQVKPNPYIVQAPHDVQLEHKVVFYNLTQETRITIFDLSGQIIDVIEFSGHSNEPGSIFWDMFSKDGVEVASGLYIWVAEFSFGQQQGYLAIMR
jgi:hypothetical protein